MSMTDPRFAAEGYSHVRNSASAPSKTIGGRRQSTLHQQHTSTSHNHGGAGAGAGAGARGIFGDGRSPSPSHQPRHVHNPSLEEEHQLKAAEYLQYHPVLQHAAKQTRHERDEHVMMEKGAQALKRSLSRGPSPKTQLAYQRARQGLVGRGVASSGSTASHSLSVGQESEGSRGRAPFLATRQHARSPSPAGLGYDGHTSLPYQRNTSPRVRGGSPSPSASLGASASVRTPGYYGPSNAQVRAKRAGTIGLVDSAQSRRDYRSPSPRGGGGSAPFLQPDYEDDFTPGGGYTGGGSNYISRDLHGTQHGLNSSGVTQAVTRSGLQSHSAHGHNIYVDSVGKASRMSQQDAAVASQHWREAHSAAGKRYYYNVVTQESTYRRPPNFTPLA